jgi:hypothetical protein
MFSVEIKNRTTVTGIIIPASQLEFDPAGQSEPSPTAGHMDRARYEVTGPYLQ